MDDSLINVKKIDGLNVAIDTSRHFFRPENCCGCSACYAICPVHAIQMESDEEGFAYPKVDKTRCIQCQQCIMVCAFKKDQLGNELVPQMEG